MAYILKVLHNNIMTAFVPCVFIKVLTRILPNKVSPLSAHYHKTELNKKT